MKKQCANIFALVPVMLALNLSLAFAEADLTIRSVSANDPRVTQRFSDLGQMFQIGELILGARAPSLFYLEEAIDFCSTFGIGYRMPYKYEWYFISKAIAKASSDGTYDSHYLPDFDGHIYWSTPDNWSTVLSKKKRKALFAMIFDGSSGGIFQYEHEFPRSVRCVKPL